MREFKDNAVMRSVTPAAAFAASMLLKIEDPAQGQGELQDGVEALWTNWLRRRCKAMPAKTPSAEQRR